MSEKELSESPEFKIMLVSIAIGILISIAIIPAAPEPSARLMPEISEIILPAETITPTPEPTPLDYTIQHGDINEKQHQ